MENEKDKFLRRVHTKGFIESICYATQLVGRAIGSTVYVFMLRLRGYEVSWGARIAFTADFFQSMKHAVSVGTGSKIGRNVRVNAGYNGRIRIGTGVLLDDGTSIMSQSLVAIGDDSQIAAYCFIVDFNHSFSSSNVPIVHQGYDTKPITIGKDVWIGTHSIILKGVTIGDGCVIGAGSVVTKDIPPFTVVAGNPAKIISRRK